MTQHSYVGANDALTMLLKKLLREGQLVPSRNGDTKELLMEQFTLRNPLRRYITVPGRNVSLPAQIAETMWLLAGRDDIGWLENYLPRAKDFSDDGVIWRGAYGPRIRRWPAWNVETDETHIDQLAHVVKLLQEDPDTRRAIMVIYNPVIDTAPGRDIPCNNWIHFITRDGLLHGHVTIRSNDIIWGWSGINQFEWSALLEIVAGLVGVPVGSLTFSVSSLHVYEHHYERAERIVEEAAKSGIPMLAYDPGFQMPDGYTGVEGLDALVDKWFRIERMIREEPRGSAWNSILEFPEPMMKSWLEALYVWWHGLQEEMDVVTEMDWALRNSPKRKKPEPEERHVDKGEAVSEKDFVEFVAQLHREKHAAYGDSWKKRGEMLGIMANIARKLGRLGVAGGGDTAADTAIDLLVYLIKYYLWIEERLPQNKGFASLTDDPEHVTRMLKELIGRGDSYAGNDAALEEFLQDLFTSLEKIVVDKAPGMTSEQLVRTMIPAAYALALRLWKKEQWKAGNETRTWKGYGE